MHDRGKIFNHQRAAQLRDFSGLLFGTITPTDIDGLIEYHDKAYIIIELKYRGTELPYGQKLAIERLCDDLQTTGKSVLGIIAVHQQDNCNLSIDVANCIVITYRWLRKWLEPQKQYTVALMISEFITNIDK